MKTVFPTDEVVHVWAKQSQSEGKNSARNVFFVDTKIWSYGRHFCMANIIKPGIVLITNRSYSNTTAKHLRAVRYATNHMQRIYVKDPENYVAINLCDFQNQIKENLDTISNTRKRPATKEQAKGNLSAIVANVNEYFTAIGYDLKKKLRFDDEKRKEFIPYFAAAQDEQAAAILIEKLAKNEKAKAARIARHNKKVLKEENEQLNKWLAGENIDTYSFSNIQEVKLRRKDDEIQTSKGARVSVKAGELLFKAIQAGKDVKGFDIDGYTVISLNGVLKVGCHEIARTEIERFAKTQNWI